MRNRVLTQKVAILWVYAGRAPAATRHCSVMEDDGRFMITLPR